MQHAPAAMDASRLKLPWAKDDAPRADLLFRLFESEWFNEWMCLHYLYQNSSSPGVEQYLCTRLLAMPEASVERYLLQLVYLAVARPGSALERTVVALCSQSFPISLKVLPHSATHAAFVCHRVLAGAHMQHTTMCGQLCTRCCGSLGCATPKFAHIAHALHCRCTGCC